MVSYYIDAGFLQVVCLWLRVLPDGSLPPYELRFKLFTLLDNV